VRTVFSDPVNIQLALRSLRTFETFGQQFGQQIDLRQVGYLFLLDQPEQVVAFERSIVLQNEMGIESRLIDVAEAKRLSPLIDTDGLVAAAWSPRDGYCTPESVILGYASAARRAGVCIVRDCAVVGIDCVSGRIAAVETERGRICTDSVICCAGAWSKAVAAMVKVKLQVEPLRRQILTTGPVPGLDPDTPFTIDFSTSLYFHREGPGLLVGMSDPGETPGYNLSRSDDWLPRLAAAIEHRAPTISDLQISSGWAGLYEVTPDHNALIGEAPEVSRFLYATGFSGHGFLMGPAVGEVVRDLYLRRQTVVDISGFDAKRFGRKDIRPELNII
jgi:sarcosine oxidase subunit beta